jgi:hypothetical protein
MLLLDAPVPAPVALPVPAPAPASVPVAIPVPVTVLVPVPIPIPTATTTLSLLSTLLDDASGSCNASDSNSAVEDVLSLSQTPFHLLLRVPHLSESLNCRYL